MGLSRLQEALRRQRERDPAPEAPPPPPDFPPCPHRHPKTYTQWKDIQRWIQATPHATRDERWALHEQHPDEHIIGMFMNPLIQKGRYTEEDKKDRLKSDPREWPAFIQMFKKNNQEEGLPDPRGSDRESLLLCQDHLSQITNRQKKDNETAYTLIRLGDLPIKDSHDKVRLWAAELIDLLPPSEWGKAREVWQHAFMSTQSDRASDQHREANQALRSFVENHPCLTKTPERPDPFGDFETAFFVAYRQGKAHCPSL
jgi:hypothetical protein